MKVCVECNPDEVLIDVLGYKDIIHEGPKPEVTRRVVNNDDVLGIEDEDPSSEPSELLGNFTEVRREMDLALLEWKGRRIILICPKLEDWILSAARESHIDVRDARYHLPDQPYKLKKVINKRLDSYRLLVEDLKDNPRLVLLRRWIEESF